MEGNWTWAYTHEPFDYTDWAPGEPNSLKGDHNVVSVNLNSTWENHNELKKKKHILIDGESHSY